MAVINLGRVSPFPRGQYSALTEYSYLDLVTDSGSSYLYVNPTPAAGIAVSDTSHWQQIAEKGATIVSGAFNNDILTLTKDDGVTLQVNINGITPATTAANDAAALANEKAALANTKAGLADAAATGANTAKTSTEAATLSALAALDSNATWTKDTRNPAEYYPAPSAPLYFRREGAFTQAGSGDPSPTNIRPITPWMANGAKVKLANSGKNLFDKTNATQILTAYISSGAIIVGSPMRIVFIPCLPNTTYTVRKTVSQKFTVGYTIELPANTVAVFGITSRDEASSISITTGADAKYLVAYVYNGNIDNTITAQQLLDSIQIELGSVATPYEPYVGSTAELTAPEEIAAGWMDNRGEGQKTWGKLVLNGSQSISNAYAWDDTKPNWVATMLMPVAFVDSALSASDKLKKVVGAPNLDSPEYVFGFSGNYVRFTIPMTALNNPTSTAQAITSTMAWLAANPVTIYYQLATPTALSPVSAPINSIPATDLAVERQNVFTSSLSGVLTYPKNKVRQDRILNNAQLWRKTASGNPVSVYPVPESPLYPKVSGTFTQSGTGDPSPSNIRPITPWLASGGQTKVKRTGKNLITFAERCYRGGYNSGIPYINSLITPPALPYVPSGQDDGFSFMIPCFAGKVYKASITNPALYTAIGLAEYPSLSSASNSANKLQTTTAAADASVKSLTAIGNGVMVISLASIYNLSVPANKITITGTEQIQLEIADAATPYEPYTESEITLTAPQEIPAGWMDNEGQGQVTWAKKVFDGTESWSSGATGGSGASGEMKNILSGLPIAIPAKSSTILQGICTHYKSVTADNTHLRNTGISADGSGRIIIYDPSYNTTDVLLWKNYLAAQYAAGTPVTIYYQLDTPIPLVPSIAPLTATPQLDRITPRQNVLTASTGNVELTYAKSPIRESDELRAAVTAIGGIFNV